MNFKQLVSRIEAIHGALQERAATAVDAALIMRQFFLAYAQKGRTLSGLLDGAAKKGQSLTGQLQELFPLSWSHYAFLLQVSDERERRFYEIEAAKGRLSVREMKRQFSASLYERLALSRDKKRVYALAHKGQVIASPEDAVKAVSAASSPRASPSP